MFVTSYLVLAVLMLAVEKHHVTPFAPVRLLHQRAARSITNAPFPWGIVGRDRAHSLCLRTVRNSVYFIFDRD